MTRCLDYQVAGGGQLSGTLRLPGDKSIAHRALILGALARGETRIRNFLYSADCLATREALHSLGVRIEEGAGAELCIQGCGRQNFRAPGRALDLGNSGTGLRLLAGVLAGCSFDSVLTGDASLRCRPMQRIISPLRQMGADLQCEEGGLAPLRFAPVPELCGIEHQMEVASAQLKSCLLLAGLVARGATCIVEPQASRDHTERMLEHFGCQLQRSSTRVCITGGAHLEGRELELPGDLSSAMFAIVAACISEGSRLRVEGVGINPTRSGGLEILQDMGAALSIGNERELCGEPVADLEIEGGAALRGTEIPPERVPRAIDEFPALFIAAACARGETVLRGAAELRLKESDRLAAMAEGLRLLGVELELFADGIRICGRQQFCSAELDSRGDHRVAMAFAVAALRTPTGLRVRDCANVRTSWPDFVPSLCRLGLQVSETAA